MPDFSLATALVIGCIGSWMVSATLYLQWRLKPHEHATLHFAIAFNLNALRMLARLASLSQGPYFFVISEWLMIGCIGFLWAGARLDQKLNSYSTATFSIAGTLAIWSLIALAIDVPLAGRLLPLLTLVSITMLWLGLTYTLRPPVSGDITQKPLGILLILFGIQALAGPFLYTTRDFEAYSFIVYTLLMYGIGVAMIVRVLQHDYADSEQIKFELQKTQDELKTACKQLTRTTSQYQNLFNNLPIMVHLDNNRGIIHSVNDAWIKTLGYQPEEVVNTLDRLYFTPASRRMLEATYLPKLKKIENIPPLEIQYVRKDGAIIDTILWTVFDVDEAGRFQQLIVFSMDITERKKVEQALRESEAKFSKLYRLMPDMVLISDLDTRIILDVNPAASTLTGFEIEEMQGYTVGDLQLWYDQEQRVAAFNVLLEKHEIRGFECQMRRKDGTVIWVEYSGRLIELQGRQVLFSIVRDINERRRIQNEIRDLNITLDRRVKQRTQELETSNSELEKALENLKVAQTELVRSEKLASLGSLVAGIAHELNTPIGTGVTVTSTLQEMHQTFIKQLEANQVKKSTLDNYLQSVHQATVLLNRNLSQARELVASFKQVAVDQTSAQRRPFELGEVLEEIIATLQPTLRKGGHHLEFIRPETIEMDSFPGPLGQIITNLVNNAVIHGFELQENGVIHLECTPLPNQWVQISVRDNGHGISPQNIQRIYDPFFTTKLGKGGSGLGLHIVYTIVTRVMGGRIEVASQKGHGCRFDIYLPCRAPSQAQTDTIRNENLS